MASHAEQRRIIQEKQLARVKCNPLIRVQEVSSETLVALAAEGFDDRAHDELNIAKALEQGGDKYDPHLQQSVLAPHINLARLYHSLGTQLRSIIWELPVQQEEAITPPAILALERQQAAKK